MPPTEAPAGATGAGHGAAAAPAIELRDLGRAYGERIAAYALARMPAVARHGGKPMVWMDVEGPYANGPFWQQELTTDPLAQPNPNAVAVNRAVIQGVVDGLRRAGQRIGILRLIDHAVNGHVAAERKPANAVLSITHFLLQ